jgi:hypothetical protein
MKDVTPRKLGKEERDQGRIVMAMKFLWQVLDAAQKQVDPVRWLVEGGLDAEELLECIESGRWHPVLRRWHERKAGGTRQAPTRRVLRVRRLVVLGVIALQRVSRTDGHEARRMVSAAAKMLSEAPTAETIHHWQRVQDTTTPAEEYLLALTIANSQDPVEVVGRFLDLALTMEVPAPFRVQEYPPNVARQAALSSGDES